MYGHTCVENSWMLQCATAFCVSVDYISAGVVYGIVLITVLWLCNILASYVFNICVNELGHFTSLVFLNCRDKFLTGYIIYARMFDRKVW